MINWKVRIKNITFWKLAIPAVALVVQTVLALFNITIDPTEIVGKILAVVSAVFAVLGLLGVVVDPTTEGVGDSKRAMSYEEPWKDQVIQPPDDPSDE